MRKLMLLALLVGGCASQSGGQAAALGLQTQADRIDNLETMLAKVTLRVASDDVTATAGGDVNMADPWPARIMAANVAITPCCFVVYVLVKRSRGLRRFWGQTPTPKTH